MSPAIANACSAARDIGVFSRSSAYVGVLKAMCSPNPLIQTGRCLPLPAMSALAIRTPAPPWHPHDRLEHVDRIGDHRAVQHVVDRDRVAVENRPGMCAGVRALVDRDLREGGGVVAELGA